MTGCPYCGATRMKREVTYAYDDHIMRQYRCVRCGQYIRTREALAGTVDYTRFAPPTDDRLSLTLAFTGNMCRGLQDLPRKDFLKICDEVISHRRKVLVIREDE